MEPERDGLYRILTLNGGGSKGIYSIGALEEIEGRIRACTGYERLADYFDLIYGTSTGSIIAALLAIGKSVEEIKQFYFEAIPQIMKPATARIRSRVLEHYARAALGVHTFESYRALTPCDLGITATRCDAKRPLIFKSDVTMAHRGANFVPGFGCSLADAVVASSAATPYFRSKKLRIQPDNCEVELIDGGFVANDPTLFAISDALSAKQKTASQLRVLNIGVGDFPLPVPKSFSGWCGQLAKKVVSEWLNVPKLQLLLEANSNTLQELEKLLPGESISRVRINSVSLNPDNAADMLERNRSKLELLFSQGMNEARDRQTKVDEVLFQPEEGTGEMDVFL